MPSATSWYGTFKINDGAQGWTETFNMVAGSYGAASADLEAIWALRVKTLPPTASLAYGSVGQRGKPRDAQPIGIAFPAAGTSVSGNTPATTAFSNDSELAIHYRMYTADGKGVSYHLRDIPDGEVENKVLKNGLPVIPVFPLVNAGLTWLDRVGDLLSIIFAKTQYSQRVADLPGPPPTPQFNTSAWSRIVYRGLRKKNTGRPFGLSVGHARPR